MNSPLFPPASAGSGGDTLDTTVHGDIGAARAMAAGLRQLHTAVYGLAGTFQAHQNLTQNWLGPASNAYGDYTQKRYGDAESAAQATDSMATGTDAWCDDMGTVTSRMQSIRDTASGAGIPVSGNIVGPPPPAPSPLQMVEPGTFKPTASIDEITQHAEAEKTYSHQQDVWNELHQSLAEARGLEQAATDTMAQLLGKAQVDLNGIIAVGGKAATTGLAFSASVKDASTELATLANRSRDTAISAFQRMKDDPSQTNLASYQSAWKAAESDAAKQSKFNETFGRAPLQGAASFALDRATGLRLLGKLPVLGTLVNGGLTAASILNGTPPGKAVTQTVSSTGAAILAGEAIADLTPEGVAGVLIETGVGAIVGSGVSYTSGKVYDEVATQGAKEDYKNLKPGG